MNLSREEPRKPELNKCVIDGRFDVFVVTKVTTLFCWIRLQINADTETTALLQQYSCKLDMFCYTAAKYQCSACGIHEYT
jgi:hypothetical protein